MNIRPIAYLHSFLFVTFWKTFACWLGVGLERCIDVARPEPHEHVMIKGLFSPGIRALAWRSFGRWFEASNAMAVPLFLLSCFNDFPLLYLHNCASLLFCPLERGRVTYLKIPENGMLLIYGLAMNPLEVQRSLEC